MTRRRLLREVLFTAVFSLLLIWLSDEVETKARQMAIIVGLQWVLLILYGLSVRRLNRLNQ